MSAFGTKQTFVKLILFFSFISRVDGCILDLKRYPPKGRAASCCLHSTGMVSLELRQILSIYQDWTLLSHRKMFIKSIYFLWIHCSREFQQRCLSILWWHHLARVSLIFIICILEEKYIFYFMKVWTGKTKIYLLGMYNIYTPNEFSCAVIKENIYHADQNNCKNIKSPHVVIDAIFLINLVPL